MNAFQYFAGEPLRSGKPGLALFRISQMLHDRTNGKFDELYMSLAKLTRRKVVLPESPLLPVAEVADTVSKMHRDGYTILPYRLALADVEEISDFAFSKAAFGREFHVPIRVERGAIPEGQPRYTWWTDEVLTVPAVQRILTDGPYCAIAQNYLGCRPILTHVNLFLDRPYVGKYEPYNYHYDNDGPGFLKFFFFLTDVEIGTGAHYFLAGTQPHSKPKQFAKAAIYQAQALYDHYGRDKEVVVRGPAGTILAEDTSGFHRGSTLERDYRLMLQLQFSALDIPSDQEFHRKVTPVPVQGLHPGVEAIARKFLVRAR
jgi:hypothetical protein